MPSRGPAGLLGGGEELDPVALRLALAGAGPAAGEDVGEPGDGQLAPASHRDTPDGGGGRWREGREVEGEREGEDVGEAGDGQRAPALGRASAGPIPFLPLPSLPPSLPPSPPTHPPSPPSPPSPLHLPPPPVSRLVYHDAMRERRVEIRTRGEWRQEGVDKGAGPRRGGERYPKRGQEARARERGREGEREREGGRERERERERERKRER